MKHFACLTLFFILFGLMPLQAQESTIPENRQRLTLNQAVGIALEQNFRVTRSRAQLNSEESRVRQAYGNFMPNLNLSASASQRQQTGPFIFEGQRFTATQTSTTISSGVNSSVTLFDGFSNIGVLNQARYNRESADLNVQNTERLVVTNVYNLYFDIFRRQELLRVREENLKRSQAQLERIIESNRVGAVPIVDVYRQQVQVGNEELQLIQAEQNLENAKSDLIFYLGLNPLQDFEFDPAGVPTTITDDAIEAAMQRFADFNELQQRTLARRPDVEAAQQRVYAAESNVSSARGNFWPTVNLSAGYNLSGDGFNTIDESRALSYRLDFSIPLFQRFQRSNQVQQAQVQLQQIEIEHNELRNQALLDIRQAYLALETSKKRVDVTRQNIVSAREEQRLAEERYNLGAGTLLDLIIANANLVEAESNSVDAIFSFYLAIRQLDYLIGEELY
jgi:outer membrane protein